MSRPEQAQAHPVAPDEIVLGDGTRGPNSHVERAGVAVDASADTDLDTAVDDQEHAGVLLRHGAGDVQGTGAQRDAPLHPPEPVAWLERPDAAKLAALTGTTGRVRAHQSYRVRRRRSAVEAARHRQRGERLGGGRDRSELV